jgi:large subunit ribosomal protein L1
MAKHGKKRKEAAKVADLTKAYPLNEAIALLKKVGYTKFDGSVEIAVKTNADAKYNDQMMRGTTILPHGTGKTKKIAVFTADEKTAKDA